MMTARMRSPVAEAFGFAVCVLGLGPREAWALTPRELGMVAGFLDGREQGAPKRDDLDRLMAAFPDLGPQKEARKDD